MKEFFIDALFGNTSETQEQRIKLEMLESKFTEVTNEANNDKKDKTVNDTNISHFPENESSQPVEETNHKNKDSAKEIRVKLRKIKRKTKMTLKEQLKEDSENISIKEFVDESQEIL